jgi:cytochrome c biogenesis protein CcmG/thiol:disulfide interchange protein DsbE
MNGTRRESVSMGGMSRFGRLRSPVVAVAVALAVVGLPACGSSGGAGQGSKPPDYAKALAGAPGPLAALYEQGGELLSGGQEAFEKRLAELRGHPVVVNKWASWCGPCRAEFPFFQHLSAKFGKRVAFVGVDSNDSSSAARTFLKEFPVPYPSYSDPGQDIAQLTKATVGFPGTTFYDERGNIAYVRQGQYASEPDLAADIRRYALGG